MIVLSGAVEQFVSGIFRVDRGEDAGGRASAMSIASCVARPSGEDVVRTALT